MGEGLAWNPTETPAEEENEGGDCKVNAGWLEAQRSTLGGQTGKYLLSGAWIWRGTGQTCRVAEARRDRSPRRNKEADPVQKPWTSILGKRCLVQSRKISKDLSSLFLYPSFDTSPLSLI